MKKTSISNALHIARQRKADGGKSVYLFQDPMGYLAKKGEQIAALPGNIADMASAAWEHPLTQAMRVAPGETSKAVGEFALEKGKQGVEYARENPFGATRKTVDFITDFSADPRVILAKQLFSSTPANAGEDEFARQVQYGIRPALEAEPPQYAGGGFIREHYADGSRVLGALSKAAGDIAKKYAQSKALPQVQEAADLPGFLVYHGSPHKFEKFDISKIGTGEGNASYGPGLYFAEKEKVARGYRDKLAGPEGHMYEARINAPQEHFLDWNKPFHEQSEHVQNSLMNVPNFESFGHYKSGMDMGDLINRGLIPHTYDKASQEFLQAYRDAGIPGIKYFDQGSRVEGMADPTRNYVVFDDKLIDTMRRYANGGPITANALMLLSKKAKSRPGRR